jgi:galactofuranosylgalactofuranosylrhamnosyl-N-acetylglucosaminyl-diphospho-decaprenol beta-1,5/1,6-galactofuranosyltransferase
MAETVLQRIVTPPRRGLTPLYYRYAAASARPRRQSRRALVLPRGAVVRTDTWFNAFFASYWWNYTCLSELVLQLRVSGSGVLRLYRRCPHRHRSHLLQEIAFVGQDRQLHVTSAEMRPLSENGGLLFFEIEARSSSVVLHQAEWTAREILPKPIRLVAGICTFNRPSLLLPNIAALLADPDVAPLLERVLVVDQGTAKVRNHPAFAALARAAAGRLQLVEQDNYGGSGGFTRCLLEAQNAGSATHVLLMDDDILLEPESVLRATAFLSLARNDLAVGGHMLDRFRPRQLVEPGSRYLPEQVRIEEPNRRRLDRANDMTPFLELHPRHYNGWWFFAFPLAVLDRVGLPLPLFLRGDDLEFGCRLMRHGVPTVTLPGVAVWHEPFERKGRGWHAFYELRNLLIVGALHFPIIRAAMAARRFFSRLLDELLAYDYYEAWLMCEAVEAYLRGPEALGCDIHAIQQRLQAMGTKLAPKTQSYQEWRTGSVSRRLWNLLHPAVEAGDALPVCLRLWRWRLVLRNLLLPSPSTEVQPRQLLHGSGEQWYNVANAEVVGVVGPYRSDVVVLRRSRSRFIRLLLRGSWLALRLLSSHRRTVRRWRASAYTLASRLFWMGHLRLRDLSFREMINRNDKSYETINHTKR